MPNEEITICQDCGQGMFEVYAYYKGKPLCESCSENYSVCEHCGEYLANTDDIIAVEDVIACPTCARRHWAQCECCSKWYNPNSDGSWGDMCLSCAEEHFECENCGGIFHNDDYREDGLCWDCYDSTNNKFIHEYHQDRPNLCFHGDQEETLFFGVELETDYYDSLDLGAEALYNLSEDENLFWLSEDSSLSRGVEIITQPCTLDYHRDQFPWAEITKTVTKYRGKSHDTKTCGLHVHFSRAFYNNNSSKLYQIRLVYLFEKFYEELVILSRRDRVGLDNAQKYDRSMYDKPASRKLQELKDAFHRYQAVNLCNQDTIEIRIFRGSLNINTILASIELADFLVRLAKKASNKTLQAMTWADLTKRIDLKQYRYLPNYIKGRMREEDKNVSNCGEA